MTIPLLEIVSGWTGSLGPFTLKLNGATFSLSGFTVTPVLRNDSGDLVTTTGSVTVDPDQVTNRGQLTYNPGATDFVWADTRTINIFRLHWKVIDGVGKEVDWPNSAGEQIFVHRQ